MVHRLKHMASADERPRYHTQWDFSEARAKLAELLVEGVNEQLAAVQVLLSKTQAQPMCIKMRVCERACVRACVCMCARVCMW